MNRRTFLQVAGITTACVVMGATGIIVASMLNQDEFEATQARVAQILIKQYGETRGKMLAQRVQQEPETTLAQLPNIGTPEENKWVEVMPSTALALAVYRVLVPAYGTLEDVGQIMYNTVQSGMSGIPAFIMRATYNGQGIMGRLKLLAARSQRRQYPEDWVITFVEGDGQDFTYGVDVAECAVLKYLTVQGVPELTRYLCLTDYLGSEAMGRGLVRYQTLAEGCPFCDFRYKQGRASYVHPLRDGWPPKFVDRKT